MSLKCEFCFHDIPEGEEITLGDSYIALCGDCNEVLNYGGIEDEDDETLEE